MAHPQTKAEILAALESNASTIVEFFSTQPEARLLGGDSDHWGPLHHLVHLTRTSAAIQRGLRSKSLPTHPTRRSRPYAEVRDAGAASLVATPKEKLLEMGRVVEVAPDADRARLVGDYLQASADLRTAAADWSEDALDLQAMPHPLIGLLTVREMLLFCVFHERHHLKQVRTRLDASTEGEAGSSAKPSA